MWERVLQKDRMHKICDVEWDWECCKSKKSEVGRAGEMEACQESLEKLGGITDIQLDVVWDFKHIFFKS